jgi:Protein of unknown function (DUF3311)
MKLSIRFSARRAQGGARRPTGGYVFSCCQTGTNVSTVTGVTRPADSLETKMSTSNPTNELPTDRRTRLPVATQVAVAVLLLIPCVALAAVPLYSRETPKLWGWPFFYWFQMLWVIITPVVTYTAYVLIRRARGERR